LGKRFPQLWLFSRLPQRRPFSAATWFWLLLLFTIITLLTVYHSVQQSAADGLKREAYSQLARLRSQLESALDRHAYLPELLAANREVQDFLQTSPADATKLAHLNQYLEQANTIAGTADIYLMRADGLTITASNWNKPFTFIGKNFAFRPYFQQAIQGKTSRYYALGTTSGERGYYFAAPVHTTQGTVLGVVAVKVGVETLESGLAQRNMDFIVTDPDGIVFMSNPERWRYHALQALPADKLAQLRDSRRYADTVITPLPDLSIQPNLLEQQVNEDDTPYLVLHNDMMDAAGWHLYLLVDRGSVSRTALLAVLFAAILLTLSSLLIYLLWKNQRQRREYEQHIREELEAKVEKRTRELRYTQEELVQAAKMAALGQLSAGINHELNNPLTAIRAYADNAAQFLDIGKPDIARNNLTEIVALTERMATITRQLKTFSRKSTGQMETCDLHRALDSALSIVQPKLAQTRVQLEQLRADHTRYVQADLVWLEQILVNLLSNAVEAVQEQDEQHIWITLQQADGQVCVSVRDNGAGISEQALPRVFEAFFTTKTVGKGLGLGLSISYRLAKDMHGHLAVRNAREGGAIFTLSLQQAADGGQQ
jgi:two-component system C4-dicarboxylate transport sensor histidine kinase DctB